MASDAKPDARESNWRRATALDLERLHAARELLRDHYERTGQWLSAAELQTALRNPEY